MNAVKKPFTLRLIGLVVLSILPALLLLCPLQFLVTYQSGPAKLETLEIRELDNRYVEINALTPHYRTAGPEGRGSFTDKIVHYLSKWVLGEKSTYLVTVDTADGEVPISLTVYGESAEKLASHVLAIQNGDSVEGFHYELKGSIENSVSGQGKYNFSLSFRQNAVPTIFGATLLPFALLSLLLGCLFTFQRIQQARRIFAVPKWESGPRHNNFPGNCRAPQAELEQLLQTQPLLKGVWLGETCLIFRSGLQSYALDYSAVLMLEIFEQSETASYMVLLYDNEGEKYAVRTDGREIALELARILLERAPNVFIGDDKHARKLYKRREYEELALYARQTRAGFGVPNAGEPPVQRMARAKTEERLGQKALARTLLWVLAVFLTVLVVASAAHRFLPALLYALPFVRGHGGAYAMVNTSYYYNLVFPIFIILASAGGAAFFVRLIIRNRKRYAPKVMVLVAVCFLLSVAAPLQPFLGSVNYWDEAAAYRTELGQLEAGRLEQADVMVENITRDVSLLVPSQNAAPSGVRMRVYRVDDSPGWENYYLPWGQNFELEKSQFISDSRSMQENWETAAVFRLTYTMPHRILVSYELLSP